MRNPLLSRIRFVFGAVCLVCLFVVALPAQQAKPPAGRLPLIEDGPSHRVMYSKPVNPSQAAQLQNERRWWQQYIHQNQSIFTPGNNSSNGSRHHFRGLRGIQKDWAVSLGAGGVAAGTYPAKYTFDVLAAPSCTNDFVVFPINASTGYTRANFIGTFTGAPTAGQTATVTITPTGDAAVNLVLTAGGTNTGTTFATSATASVDASNLADAINRNLSATALDEVAAVASGATVTVYALTPGSRVVLTDAETLANFAWGAVTAGTSGAQANIVGFNQLYSGSGAPLCTGLSDPEFIFSYASGVGPVPGSPSLSFDGKKIAYVENDPNIGAIFHVLTFATGSTEYGAACAASNDGLVMPTCATSPVVPGSTAGSTATDYMLPLGLVAADATTGAAGASSTFSSPFVNYNSDTTTVGDDNGLLYSITPTFTGTPAFAGGNFPVQVIATPATDTPTVVKATAATVTITVPNTLSPFEMVDIDGVLPNGGHCTAGTAAAINGIQYLASANATTITFAAPPGVTATTGTGCTVTPGVTTVMPGTSFLSPPSIDIGGTGNIFVGDSSGNLYMLTPAGATAAPSVSVGSKINGGVRGSPLVDSVNAIGFAVTACDNSGALTGGESGTTNSALWQFSFTSSALTKVAGAELDSGADQGCTHAGFPINDPVADARYFALGISSATAADNGEIITGSTGTGGQQLKAFQFVSSALVTTPEGGDKPQINSGGPSVVSPLTEFWNTSTLNAAVTAVTATTTTVTVTAANTLAAGDMVRVLGVSPNAGNGCTSGDTDVIDGPIQTVASATSTSFTFDATIPSATSGSGCTVTGATATGGPDYMFMGIERTSTLYSFLLPSGVLIPGLDNLPTTAATNTTDAVGGTSAIIVDNDSNSGQASSLYYGTLGTSTTLCGATAAFCAIKVTQGALQ